MHLELGGQRRCALLGSMGHGTQGSEGKEAWPGTGRNFPCSSSETVSQDVIYRCDLFLFRAILIKFIFKDLLILIVVTVFECLQDKHTPHRLKTDTSEDKARLKACIITLNIT